MWAMRGGLRELNPVNLRTHYVHTTTVGKHGLIHVPFAPEGWWGTLKAKTAHYRQPTGSSENADIGGIRFLS